MCPDCCKPSGRSCRYPSHQHWTWCPQFAALHAAERDARRLFAVRTRPIERALDLPDLPPRYRGHE